MIIQTIVIEDEEKSRHVIFDLIKQFTTDLELCGTAGSVEQSVQLIESKAPHLVFMDIQIADGTGFDVLRKLTSRNFELICITAFDNYAVEAVRFSAVDYLLKPIGIPEFQEAVERARKRINEKTKNQHIDTLFHSLIQQSNPDKKISIATVNGYEFIDMKDIIWCHSEGSYTTFHLVNNTKLISSRNLGSYETLLCANNFCRIHNTSIVNLRFIKSYIKGKSGYLIMTNGTKLEISQRRKGDFLNRL
ncbi:LytR/AlgR family response regulator transcription factor [Chitinophaga nivalis]|uniref:LytTR family DNA-binding domain-containing protein n=1 Tax=Chitinophaga nivalis TaxID=2991709 RepID=A0ABT3IM53_9BACT|nr:LytTR family DNA-binding domain-containing protein [Chitinophaga nivalis]MCW3465322.1 LytTR family DNA-binding domain-containing protein [Chitinophaga nivalis]MCW3484986.1 LytTR family DNA-binding domain-containing protein [Chitinophaga nivalis]